MSVRAATTTSLSSAAPAPAPLPGPKRVHPDPEEASPLGATPADPKVGPCESAQQGSAHAVLRARLEGRGKRKLAATPVPPATRHPPERSPGDTQHAARWQGYRRHRDRRGETPTGCSSSSPAAAEEPRGPDPALGQQDPRTEPPKPAPCPADTAAVASSHASCPAQRGSATQRLVARPETSPPRRAASGQTRAKSGKLQNQFSLLHAPEPALTGTAGSSGRPRAPRCPKRSTRRSPSGAPLRQAPP